MGAMVPDAAAKHKQLSQLLQSSSAGQTSMVGQLSTLCKSPLGQASPSHPSQTQKSVATPGGPGNSGSPGMSMNTGFNQAVLNSTQAHGIMSQNMAQQGPMLNGMMGQAGRGRPAPGMQYQGQTMQGTPVGGAGTPGVSLAGSVLAETLTQGAPQMSAHTTINPQQMGNMVKVSVFPPV